MAKVKLLIDTDIVIDYLNTGLLRTIFEDRGFEVYYSVVTKKELLSKPGLKETERQAVLFTLRRHRIIPLDDRITGTYSDLRRRYPSLEKEDALIAATALVKKLPLVTRNVKHYKNIQGLILFKG
ncbi:MAG: type II toxin-antitoxin system VapC family toxin [Nitrospirae bacterium]|nr:type II toxin-antitoxin system VapC family toxin [Nitrospirota bacterium]